MMDGTAPLFPSTAKQELRAVPEAEECKTKPIICVSDLKMRFRTRKQTQFKANFAEARQSAHIDEIACDD